MRAKKPKNGRKGSILGRHIHLRFEVEFLIIVVSNILDKNYRQIHMDDLGDLSWNIKILLNSNVQSEYDWDKKLAIKCGQARILEVYINSIIPAYTLNPFYISYNQKENYYEFGKISKMEKHEKIILDNVSKCFDSLGYFCVSEELASKK